MSDDIQTMPIRDIVHPPNMDIYVLRIGISGKELKFSGGGARSFQRYMDSRGWNIMDRAKCDILQEFRTGCLANVVDIP